MSGGRTNVEGAEVRRGSEADPNAIGETILGAAMRVHSTLGPGLLETVYETCLAHELAKRDRRVARQVVLPVEYYGERIEVGCRLDLVVDGVVVVEVKAVDRLAPIHAQQLLTYLRLGNYKLGYLLNFNVAHMRDGIKRIVNGL